MKRKHSPVSNPKTSKRILICLALLLAGTSSIEAQELPGASIGQATVKTVHVENSTFRYRLQIPNPEGEKFSVTITDREGHRLFHQVYEEKKFDTQYQLEEGLEHNQLQISVRSLKDNHAQVFAVNTGTRIQIDYVLTPLLSR